ncbi:hypothetical protein M9M90_07005 [Phenylobacterium sp. LH3H17]|uniref:hypothetical protein n=1 Tax=Phenylobacterium sp. LH3H17 TaxID=2903901 RepID=UPI0020C9DA78|nr:hypothetical protein [Phenylobacterium sp. LH3H17]UTP40924.1 hypothetical protein M9M90_07005 [Phenylobacterium sp. LH3H17]
MQVALAHKPDLGASMDISQLARTIFPRGYITYPQYRRAIDAARQGRSPQMPSRRLDLRQPPILAADLFAIAASLLLRSGAYHHISPEIGGVPGARTITVSEVERDRWIIAGGDWRGDGERTLLPHPKPLLDAWKELWANPLAPVYKSIPLSGEPPAWWRPALALMAMADEAALNIGFDIGTAKSAQAASAELAMRGLISRGHKVQTLSAADPDHVCVLPKSRTPRVGCTLRSLSHHLSLLPPRGLAKAYWVPSAALSLEGPAESASPAAFNVVTVPLPFRIRATAFGGSEADQPNWGWFRVTPHWCPGSDEKSVDEGMPAFLRFLDAVLDRAARDVGEVHCLVFPELALSHRAFLSIAGHLSRRDGFELLVSGLFDAAVDGETPREGNFAAMAQFAPNGGQDKTYTTSVREKHHRWRLDRSQIETYALGASLDANRGWWEKIDILSRSLDIFTIRGEATVTTLICEDLARHDPCQELVRGIGPNLLFALLMDSAQLKDRWSGRYATVLADDPGSSVLTFTSLGLIERANDTGQFPKSRKVGLWRDDSGRTVEIDMPVDAQAMCLTLQPTPLTEHTLDGRSDRNVAQSWRLTGLSPVSIDTSSYEASVVLGGRWPAEGWSD